MNAGDARDNLSHENVVKKQAASLKDFAPDTLLPGITISTSATDYAPIAQLRMMRFKGDKWELFGEVIYADTICAGLVPQHSLHCTTKTMAPVDWFCRAILVTGASGVFNANRSRRTPTKTWEEMIKEIHDARTIHAPCSTACCYGASGRQCVQRARAEEIRHRRHRY